MKNAAKALSFKVYVMSMEKSTLFNREAYYFGSQCKGNLSTKREETIIKHTDLAFSFSKLIIRLILISTMSISFKYKFLSRIANILSVLNSKLYKRFG